MIRKPVLGLSRSQMGIFVLAIALVSVGVWSMKASVSAAPESSSKTLRHVVQFQFKEGTSEKDIDKVIDAFRELPRKIPEIAEFEYGVNNSPEGLDHGYTHCFLVTFRSEQDRDAYLPHPAHQAFVEVLKPHLEKAHVLDYWAKH